MQLIRQIGAGAGVFFSYVATALIFHWPLPARLGSALTGPIGGDTGVYVWNLWVFRHEIVAHRRFPLFTQEILALAPPVDLSLHNYTLFANVLAFPLLPILGVTTTFNVIFLTMTALTAWTMYLLARKVVGRGIEAWLAGLLFGFSPILVARSTAHFSLVAAAPLPVFVLCLMRLEERPTVRNAVAAGATVAWAATCDPYFAVYCLVIAVCYGMVGVVRVHRAGGWAAASQALTWVLDGVIAAISLSVVALAVLINFLGVVEMRAFGRAMPLSMHAPVIALMVSVLGRLAVHFRPQLELRMPRPPAAAIRAALVASVACVLLLSPLLYVMFRQLTDGGALHGPIYWRSGPKGLDLLAFFTPNPSNKFMGEPSRGWLTAQNNGYAENVGALTWVAIAVVVVAVWRFRFRPPRLWVALTAFFGALALGPFIWVGGINTYVLGPWALLRYVPVLSAARMPTRFVIVAMMAFTIVFALALNHVAAARPERRRLLLAAVAILLAFELAPLPRRLYAAPVPDVYQVIAADPRDIRVMGIPLGIVDGERGEGLYNGSSQFYQTFHQKPIVGGGLSRISDRVRQRQRRMPVIRLLMQLSEGRMVSAAEIAEATIAAPAFIRRARLGYVVIETSETSPALRQAAIDILRLEKVAESAGRELYRPVLGDDPPLLQ